MRPIGLIYNNYQSQKKDYRIQWMVPEGTAALVGGKEYAAGEHVAEVKL